MFNLTDIPAFWGFWGSLVYAAGRLISVISGEARADARAVKRAIAYFLVAVIFGTVAAQAFGPTITDWVGSKARPQAVSFTVGLSVNGLWPAVEQMAWRSILAWIGEQLQGAGKAIASTERTKADG